jgi:putative ABC transport system permease protein
VREILFLAGRYLAYHRVKTAILILAITLIVYLPVGLNVLVDRSAAHLTARAEATPLLVGAKGSPLELTLNSLYFESQTPAPTRYADLERIAEGGLARPIPLYVRFRARDFPIVGTSVDYFDFRALQLRSGRFMAVIGECVVGSRVARDLELEPGGSIVSSPESLFDLAGVYPLSMSVVGVLEPSYGPDDRAVFVDVKTAWIIEGLGHGHQDLSRPEAAPGVLAREGNRITANASVVQYNEITPDNIESFHFHGNIGGNPLSAVIAAPNDEKSGVILQGRYLDPDERSQILRPVDVMDDLLATILTVRGFVVAAVLLVGAATVATAVLVFLLSLRLRKREMETMVKIGAARGRIAAVLLAEVLGVLVVGTMLAGGLTWLTGRISAETIQKIILSG